MVFDRNKIFESIKEAASRICGEMGIELFDVEYRTSGRRGLLRVYIDKPGGISLGDCATVSRELSTQMDIIDPFSSKYSLEVSSPGLNRPLRHLEDAEKAIGKLVKVSFTPIEGQKHITGTLVAVQNESLLVKNESDQLQIPWEKVRKANLVHEF